LIGRESDLSRRAWCSTEAAALYERARPGYAHEAVTFIAHQLGIGPGTRVVDLGAGTGKLTRQLLSLGAEVIAVEPLHGMRSALSRAVPGVQILEGRAEYVPLPDAGIDAIVAGQAWHWFDGPRALAEASRLLKPGGGMALLWNEYDKRAAWMEEYSEIRRRAATRAGAKPPSHTGDDWRRAFAGNHDWTPIQKREFTHQAEATREEFVNRVFSSSVFAVLPQDEKEDVTSEILAMLGRAFGTRDQEHIAIPYTTEVFWSRFRRG
jgi:ubiquinone/menaquinone biosynthesis C-methylase UbiE